MLLSSGKFKYLCQARDLLPEGSVPPFEIINEIGPEKAISGKYILRSSLKGEAQKDQLMSGKSLSLGGIDSWQKLVTSWERIKEQPDLSEVILQQEIDWENHITLIFEQDFFFAEIKTKNGQGQFLYWTPLGQSLHPFIKLLKHQLDCLTSLLQKDQFWLIEGGILQDQFYLFQIQPVSRKMISRVFSADLAPQIISSRLRFSRQQGLFNLLYTEWKARKFRKNMNNETMGPGAVFLNWEFLFHYFRLFCMIHQRKPEANAFGEFLSQSYQNNWLSSLVKKHLELANYYRKNETFDPMKLGFENSGPIFIGSGKWEGVVGSDVKVCDEIPLALIYGDSEVKIILSKELGLLSHPVLASVEKGIGLVLGLKNLPSQGERIYLDFEKKHLEVK